MKGQQSKVKSGTVCNASTSIIPPQKSNFNFWTEEREEISVKLRNNVKLMNIIAKEETSVMVQR